jgi:hypothetical protein
LKQVMIKKMKINVKNLKIINTKNYLMLKFKK